MSFHVSFFAKTVHGARSKLHDAYAPSVVKAVIEQALTGIREPEPSRPMIVTQGHSNTVSDAAKAQSLGAGTVNAAPTSNKFAGVLVEAYGHLNDTGGQTEFQKFIVRPVYE